MTTATPYLSIQGAAEAIEFYKKAFGAVETVRLAEPGGRIAHAELRIGEAKIMLADEYPDWNFVSPKTLGGSSVSISLEVDDADALAERAAAAGATIDRPVKDQFYGEKSGTLTDPFGHRWLVSSKMEELTNEELQHRWEGMMAGVK